jgi:dienelactone hydrolase
MKALPEMQTWAGSIAKMGVEQSKAVVPKMFETYIDPFYDSVPTLERLDVPMLWLIAGDDIEAPPGPTIAALAKLRRSGKNIQTRIFPHTDHGITEFTVNGTRRTRTRYAPDYFTTMVRWIAEQVR